MAVFNMIEEADATGKVKEVFEDIKKKRNTDYVNNFWKMLANNPETLERTWTSIQQVMKKGALDVSIQAQILNLLKDLQEQLNLTILFISHDLPVVRQMCDDIGVLRNGKLCEVSETEELFKNPNHEYTKELLRLMPKIETIYN